MSTWQGSHKVVAKFMIVPHPKDPRFAQAYLAIPDPDVPGQVLLCVLDKLCTN